MPERRSTPRSESSDRRVFPRPTLQLNLVIILLGVAALFASSIHRRSIDRRFSSEMGAEAVQSAELLLVREQLANMDLTEAGLEKALDGRMRYLDSLKSNDFFLAIDTKRKKLRLQFGNAVIREADVEIGEPRIMDAGGRRWTFPALKGGLEVTEKAFDASWHVPPWVYVLNGQPFPADRPPLPDGLGKYVIFLPNDYVIHSPPAPDSPLKGPKPASFMAPEEDLRAIWPRIGKGTKVYVF